MKYVEGNPKYNPGLFSDQFYKNTKRSYKDYLVNELGYELWKEKKDYNIFIKGILNDQIFEFLFVAKRSHLKDSLSVSKSQFKANKPDVLKEVEDFELQFQKNIDKVILKYK